MYVGEGGTNALCADQLGNVYYTSYVTVPKIYRITPATGVVTQIASFLSGGTANVNPSESTIRSSANGKIFFVWKISSDGTTNTYHAHSIGPYTGSVMTASTKLFEFTALASYPITGCDVNYEGTVFCITNAGGTGKRWTNWNGTTASSTSAIGPGIAFDGAGNLLLSAYSAATTFQTAAPAYVNTTLSNVPQMAGKYGMAVFGRDGIGIIPNSSGLLSRLFLNGTASAIAVDTPLSGNISGLTVSSSGIICAVTSSPGSGNIVLYKPNF